MTAETKTLVLQMSAGILLWNLLLAVAGILLGPVLGWTRLSIFLGLIVGGLCGVAMLVHMAVVTERVLDSGNEAYANKTTVIHAVGRKLVYIFILLVILWKLPQVNVMAVVLGTMGLKAGAYLQPVLFGRRKASDRTEVRNDCERQPDEEHGVPGAERKTAK
ncbi:MAG: hypothetical protein Q4E86_01215 [Lachnospiraceae bacterium]|nr:hypothetical protein [Lachnospiraceae bacterium]